MPDNHSKQNEADMMKTLIRLLEVCEKQPVLHTIAEELLISVNRGETLNSAKIWELTEQLQAQMNPQELWLNLRISSDLLKIALESIETVPEQIMFLQKLTQIQIITDKDEEAQQSLSQLLQLIDSDEETRAILITIGLLYIERSKIETAQQVFQTLLITYKDVIAGSLGLALIYCLKKDLVQFTNYNNVVKTVATETADWLSNVFLNNETLSFHQILDLVHLFDKELANFVQNSSQLNKNNYNGH